MKKAKLDPNRLPGSPVPQRRFEYLSTENADRTRVVVLFRELWGHPSIGPEVEEEFRPIVQEWAASYPWVTQTCQIFERAFIQRFFKVDTPTLLPILLISWRHNQTVKEGGAEAANFRIESLARNRPR